MGEILNIILFLSVLLTAILTFKFDHFFICVVVSGVLLIAFIHWWKTALAWYVEFVSLMYVVMTSNVSS